MKVAKANTIIYVLWLLAPLYWTNPQCVLSHPSHSCYANSKDTNISIISLRNDESQNFCTPFSYATSIHQKTTNELRTQINNWEKNKYIKSIFFLKSSPLQAPLAHKWNGVMTRTKRRISMDMHNNNHLLSLCRMAYSRNLDKTFDGVKDMDPSQN